MYHWLQLAASMHPQRVALIDAGVEVSYSELAERARAATYGLSERGVKAGDRVALALPAGTDFVAALHGCWFTGAVAMPIDLRLSAEERAARAAGAALILDRPLSGRTRAASVVGFELDAVAAVMHTSGTTAAPRRIELTYGNWLWSALGSAVALGLDPRGALVVPDTARARRRAYRFRSAARSTARPPCCTSGSRPRRCSPR